VHVHLAKELRHKYGKRNTQLRTGDKVKILRGQFAKKEGKVERIDLKRERVFVTGIELIKKDGTKILSPLEPSNLMIIDLTLDDKKRKHKLEEHKKSKNEHSSEVAKKETKTKSKGEK
jgi:large subunit ribosomal protein L24